MSLEWRASRPSLRSSSLAWSNPVTWWWGFLTLVSGVNIAVWFLLYHQLQPASGLGGTPGVGIMLLLCAAYVFGCAFRSFLPRADVQRICLFDTWLSSVVVGRSVATVAEICFAVGIGLCRLLPEFDGPVRVVLAIAITGIAAYLAFLMTIDVPMYLSRWRAEVADGSKLLTHLEGLRDVSTRWVVTHDLAEWKD